MTNTAGFTSSSTIKGEACRAGERELRPHRKMVRMSAGLCADVHDRVEGRAMSQGALGAGCCEEAGSEVATQGQADGD